MSESIDILKKAISDSAIKKVALIDDSFDFPTIAPDLLNSFILKETNKASCPFISADLWQQAVEEISTGEDGAATEISELLYKEYSKHQDSQFDPFDCFKTHFQNQSFVTPIVDLLKACGLRVKTYGTDVPDLANNDLPDLILVDLFFNPTLSATEMPTTGVGDEAVKTSIEKVQKLIKIDINNPAVILMSSHGSSAASRAKTYRSGIQSKVHASRFGYLDKKHVTKVSRNSWAIEDAARDQLMDIFQTYAFGKALSQALSRWTKSAKAAVEKIESDIHDLQLREIAYLVQFRLHEEGQGLEEYLEWFFGEALKDHISTEMDNLHEQQSLESSLDISAVKEIDGAFEATGAVARMYHQIRVESSRKRTPKHFRLGDLYFNVVKNEVWVVMNPDCDLVSRKNKRNADQLLLVPGEISDLKGVSVSVGDFMMINKEPCNIRWDYKRVFTRSFTECFEKPGQSDASYVYLGTLRPLYAQEIQANLLTDIGRVGVAVPPVIGMHAVASIEVKTQDGFKPLSEIHVGSSFSCSLLHGRDSKKKPRVIFGPEVIRQIKQTFVNIPEVILHPDAVQLLQNVVREDAKTIVARLKKGLEIKETLGRGIELVGDGTLGKAEADSWALIRINKVMMPSDELSITPGGAEAEPSTVGIVEAAVPEEATTETLTAAVEITTVISEGSAETNTEIKVQVEKE